MFADEVEVAYLLHFHSSWCMDDYAALSNLFLALLQCRIDKFVSQLVCLKHFEISYLMVSFLFHKSNFVKVDSELTSFRKPLKKLLN